MRPLNPAWGPVERFACELRGLRAAAGELAFWRMAWRCEAPRSALVAAVAGFELPSEPVLRAFVGVCGGDWAWWRERWLGARAEAAADAELAAAVDAVEGGQGWLAPRYPGELERVERRSVHVPPVVVASRRPRKVFRAAAAFGLAVVVAFAAGWAVRPLIAPIVGSTAASAQVGASDGDDPYLAGCGGDQQLIETKGMVWPGQGEDGRLRLFHSRRCNANWGFVTGPDSATWKVHIITHRPADSANVLSSLSPRLSANLPPGSWGVLLLTGKSCVYIEAYVETSAGRGPTATTSCYTESEPVLHG